MRRVRINPISEKQKAKNKLWAEITNQRARLLNFICEWCHKRGSRIAEFNPLNGHHIIPRRYNIHTPENCYLCHDLCHDEIENITVEQGKGKEYYIREV